MINMRVRLTFTEGILGTLPPDEEIYRSFVASKAPDATTIEDEVASVGADEAFENKITVFPRDEEGNPFLYDYQIKGFFKDTCGGLRRASDTLSAKVTAFKKEIDKLIFMEERKIKIHYSGTVGICQRPLRAQTAQGDRIALAASEELPAGSWIEFTIVCLADKYKTMKWEDILKEWLDYGKWSGIGQWRNSGKGRFVWELVE